MLNTKQWIFAATQLLFITNNVWATPTIQPPHSPAHPLYKNEIGIYQQNYYISDEHAVWDYTTLFYGHSTDIGTIYGKVNYNSRLFHDGVQAEVQALPQLNQYIYLDLQVAVANQPVLFPNQLYGGEVYISMPHTFDFSVGGKYHHIDSTQQYSLFTGTLAKQIKQDRLTYRPSFYDPNAGKSSLLHLLDYRHIINEPDYYWGMSIAAGSSPDLADFRTINYLVTQNKIFSPYINFAMFNEQLVINASFYYQHQVFNIPLVRNWVGGTLRVAWKYQ